MTSLAETALSILNPTSIVRPGKLLRSLPDIVRHILPHARYSSFLETLVVGPHPTETPTCKTPPLPVQDEVPCKDSISRDNTRCLRTSQGIEVDSLIPCPDDLVFRVIYKAHGKFAWMNGRKIEDVKVLKWLGEGAMSSAHIKSGRVETSRKDGRESVVFNYVCKTWDMSKMGQWNGFYSELALYKSARYLLPLQGDVVPHVMGVYTRPGKIDIIMDLPHPVFWIEASPSMPMVLKDRVVEAFQKLHERGVVHGDVALRHILIGADARVTLIDFQASRADDPNEDLGLSAAYPGDKAFEMRRVKFLLNTDNARKKEFRKSKAALKRSMRNRERERRRQELLKHGITVGLPLDEPEPLEDIKDPPVPLDELERYWMEDANDDPRRFVVPGSSDSDLAGAIASFLQCIQDMEGADCGWSVVCNAPSSPRSPLPSTSPPPPRDQASVLGLPPSIKVRDFAYETETTCWGPSISYPRAERRNSSSLLSSVERDVPGDRTAVSLHPRNSLKRQRENGEAKAIHLEKLPTGKRARLDFPFPGCGDAIATETKPVLGCGLVEVHPKDPESIPVLPILVLGHVSADGCRGHSPLSEPELEHLVHKRSREVAEADDNGGRVVVKKPRRFCRTA
ncbi:hypothetical protein BC827DRAFT_297484 [Russula dissimulans]|nr:hypothetical protein BC827DRAFT_297484 [Russula dissimulans]